MQKYFWKKLMVSAAAISAIGVAIPQVVQAGTELPMSISMGEGMFSLVAPDYQTTRSAYGGKLRVYDVHIAKMFEVTYSMCQSGDIGGGTSWSYAAGNGSIDMGTFNISCNLANDIALAYGLGKPERTVIQRYTEGYGSRTEVRSVSILDITGGKIGKWLGFAQRFKPVR